MARRAKQQTARKPRAKGTRRPTKLFDIKYMGEEPTWVGVEKWTTEQVEKQKIRGYSWYNHFYASSDLIKNLYEWMKKAGYTPAQIKLIRSIPENSISVTMVSAATMLLRGMPDSQSAWLRDKLAEYIRVTPVTEEKKEEVKNVYKPSIQDRMRDQLNELIGEMEEWEDGVFTNKNFEVPKVFEWLKKSNVAQAHVGKMIDFYTPKAEEINVVLSKNCEADLAEGYDNVKKVDLKRLVTFYDLLLEDLNAYKNLKKVGRKPRAKKAPSKDKTVQKLKYKLDDKELKIVSIRPIEIIGAQTLWIYNTKTRKLGKYVADSNAKQLSVKGSSIVGFDEKLSIAKTVRKPAEKLKEFAKSGKVALRTFIEDIRAVEVTLKPRINKDVILLRVN